MNHEPFVSTELTPIPDAVLALIAERAALALEVDHLTAEVDDYKTIVASLREEISKLTAEREAAEPVAAVFNGHFQQRAELEDGYVHELYLHPVLKQQAQQVTAIKAEHDALRDAAQLALCASQKFVNKVDSGQAKSVETYSEMTQVIAALKAAL